MDEERAVLFEKRDKIAYITLNRPSKYNAMNGEMYEQMEQAVREYMADEDLLCAIFSGAGNNFSAGGDLKWFQEMKSERGEGWSYDYPVYQLLDRHCQKPVIAAIDGYCLASGFNLAVLYCDIRIASDRAKLGIPAVKRGLRLPYPTPFQYHMSLGNALYMVITGKLLSADEALRMGVVSEIVSGDNLMTRATELAKMITEAAPLHVRCHKEFLRRLAEAPSFGQRLIDLTMAPLAKSDDSGEGRRAFLEKRAPVYKNK
jgi:enoyl-CoA hydratase/carnithine racemase